VKIGLTPDALKDIIRGYHGLVVRSATKVTSVVLGAAADLKVIGRAGTGVDNVDVAEATKRGIVVMNTPGGNSMATAEHTIALIMAAHRHICQAVASMKDGKWEKKRFQGREMAGKTLGVIGLGRVGSLVCRRARYGLKMNVLGYDPITAQEAAAQVGATLTPLDEIFRSSDVVTVHTPLNKETLNLVDERAFGLMKDGVIVVNCARGGIVNEEALLTALETGKVAAAALDVYSTSPPVDHPLVRHSRVISTPHLGAATDEAQIDVSVSVAEQIIDFLEKGAVRNAVNLPSVDPTQISRIEPFMDLARRLGQFLGQLVTAGVAKMEVEYRGEIASWDLKPITNSALVGLLRSVEGTDVNHVNAAVIARERGINVLTTTRKEGWEHGPSLEIRAQSGDGTGISVQGAVLRSMGGVPRIIGIEKFSTEAVPAGPMLVVRNEDIPGMIAGISGNLAASGINIAQMNLSRDVPGGMAMSIINIDTPVDDATLESIGAIKGILSVKQVILDR